jgi:hypothetical protein
MPTARSAPLPQAAKSYGDRLPVHPSGSIAAEERNHLRDFARLQYPVLRLARSTLVPHLLDTDAASLGRYLRRVLGHCRSHPARQHCV